MLTMEQLRDDVVSYHHHHIAYGGYVSQFDKEVDVTLNFLKNQLEVEEEYSDAFNIARNLLRLAQQSMNEKW